MLFMSKWIKANSGRTESWIFILFYFVSESCCVPWPERDWDQEEAGEASRASAWPFFITGEFYIKMKVIHLASTHYCRAQITDE